MCAPLARRGSIWNREQSALEKTLGNFYFQRPPPSPGHFFFQKVQLSPPTFVSMKKISAPRPHTLLYQTFRIILDIVFIQNGRQQTKLFSLEM